MDEVSSAWTILIPCPSGASESGLLVAALRWW